MTDPADLQGEVQRAVAGDPEAVRRLVKLLTPVIQARVARCLLRYQSTAMPAARSRNIRQEVEDLAQEIFLLLFAENGKVLRTWEPDRGLALANFVGLIAERRTASILRSGRRSPWQDEPSPPEDLDRESDGSGPLEMAMSRQQLERLFARLTEELSPLGRHLFDLLFVRELPLPEILATTGMTADAVYAWRSRLRRLARRLLAAESDGATSQRKTSMGGER